MKKKLLTMILTGLGIFIFVFFKKTYLNYEWVYRIPHCDETFYPLGFTFFHSEMDFKNYCKNAKDIKFQLPDTIPFDFKNYSYLIVYGRKVTKMYHSMKSNYWDEPLPGYVCRKSASIRHVFISYEEDSIAHSKGVFLYKVEKDERLSNFAW